MRKSNLDREELEKVLGGMKGAVARRANKELQRHGALWEQESYDRIVRDEEHLYRVVQYIGGNPAKAGLPRSKWHRWVEPSWEQAGWRFE